MQIPEAIWELMAVVAATLLFVWVISQYARMLTAGTERMESRTTRFYLDDPQLWSALIPKSEVRRFWRRQLGSLLGILVIVAAAFAAGASFDLVDSPILVVGFPVAVCLFRTGQILRQRSGRQQRILELSTGNPDSMLRAKILFGISLLFLTLFGVTYYFQPPSGMLLMFSIIFCWGAALRACLGWETSVYSNGLYQAGSFIPWEQVTWYRWFEKRNGVLIGTGGNLTSDHPFLLLDIGAVLPDETERLLDEFLPEKRLPDVETVRDELRASQELTRT